MTLSFLPLPQLFNAFQVASLPDRQSGYSSVRQWTGEPGATETRLPGSGTSIQEQSLDKLKLPTSFQTE